MFVCVSDKMADFFAFERKIPADEVRYPIYFLNHRSCENVRKLFFEVFFKKFNLGPKHYLEGSMNLLAQAMFSSVILKFRKHDLQISRRKTYFPGESERNEHC